MVVVTGATGNRGKIFPNAVSSLAVGEGAIQSEGQTENFLSPGIGHNAIECEAKPLIPAFPPLGRGEGDETRASVI